MTTLVTLPHEEGKLARVAVTEIPVENTLGHPFPIVQSGKG